jgi:hypothetical protein
MREEFEKVFPVPDHVIWDDAEESYYLVGTCLKDPKPERAETRAAQFFANWNGWKAATALQSARVRELEEETDRARWEKWHKGYPPSPWCHEWFIAKTFHQDRVVLTALPDEYAYDFKTADDTYIKKETIVAWMQFPDSQYIDPSEQALSATARVSA